MRQSKRKRAIATSRENETERESERYKIRYKKEKVR